MGKLTAKEAENAKPKSKKYLLLDGNGLSLQVNPQNGKYWIFRYRFQNTAKVISLGPYPRVSLQEARLRSFDCHKLLADGIDPGLKKRQEKQRGKIEEAKLFKNVAKYWYQSKEKKGRSPGTLDKMRTYLDKDILPVIGEKSVDNISRQDCIIIQENIERRNALNVAQKVRGFLRDIFDQAIAKELCEFNPASSLAVIAKPQPAEIPYPHLLESELPDFLQALSLSRSRFISTTAAWASIWTASRPGMVRFAAWHEIDFDKKLWTIPAERMKMRREHVVPLCSQLLTLLQKLYQLTGRQDYLFPGSGSKNPTISENTINKVFQLIGYRGKMVSHGSRHTASTLLREHLWPKELVDAQLSHKEAGISGKYNHAVYLKYRVIMMQWYADYLDALKEGLTPEQSATFEKRRNAALYGLYQEPLSKYPLTREAFNN
ncbi:Prophage integrase IntS [Saezia sanguinis]|uniref:Prophage integrase IntS n=1 Tax=Saezia sanguinis TaxID=1965230 RepID=A0A433SFD0_9BURK|nr:integrase arm-type DNA-binding domain-containing protein [Saezia sanguinis]RUS67453.1 Prophage integrase IntS [Saezia sanguinis]